MSQCLGMPFLMGVTCLTQPTAGYTRHAATHVLVATSAGICNDTGQAPLNICTPGQTALLTDLTGHC
jgi:hypothetical protein